MKRSLASASSATDRPKAKQTRLSDYRRPTKQTTVHAFFGGKAPPVSSGLMYGLKTYRQEEISKVDGLERNFREYWNSEAGELCADKSVRAMLGNKTAIQGAIHTSWTIPKSSLLQVKVDELYKHYMDILQDEVLTQSKLKSVKKMKQE